jgi:hypothetical protein
MTSVFSAAIANSALSAFAAAAPYMQLHTGDPGAAGTANVSSVPTRQPVTWGNPTAGVLTAVNEPEWTLWAGTNNEVVTWVSFWSASSSGTFAGSCPLDSSVTMVATDNLTLDPITFTIPTAA